MNETQKSMRKSQAVKSSLSKKIINDSEVATYINQAVVSGVSDENTTNSEDVATIVSAAMVSGKAVIHAPKATYTVSAETLKKAYKVGYGIGITGNKLNNIHKDQGIKKIAANYLESSKGIEDTNNLSIMRNHNRYDKEERIKKLVSAAYRNGIEVVGVKADSTIYGNSFDDGIWGKDRLICDEKTIQFAEKLNMKDIKSTVVSLENKNLDGITYEKKSKRENSTYSQYARYRYRKKQNKMKSKDNIKSSKKSAEKQRKAGIRNLMKSTLITQVTKASSQESGIVKKMAIKYTSMITSIFRMLAVTVIKMIFALVAAVAPYLIIPALAVILIIILFSVPPMSWITYNSEAPEIVITYQDKMREFGITIEGYEADDNSVINYELNEEQLRKDALMIFLAKKGINYRFDTVSTEDTKLYADILSELMICTMNINSFVEINDGSLITSKTIDLAVKAGTEMGAQDNEVYVLNSCNVHGVTAERTSSGSVIHTTSEHYFIPCEVSQYSVLPVGLCIQITEPNSKESYILQIVDKYEDLAEDNANLYICGDMRAEDDMGVPKDINIYTKAYGPIRYFSSSNLGYKDNNILYTGILDKAVANVFPEYNIIYRTASSLAKEFNMTEEEQEMIFGKLNQVTEQNLIDAKIMVPKKEIHIWNENVEFYVEQNLSEDEQKIFNEIKELANSNSEHYEKLVNTLHGNMSVENVINTAVKNAGSNADSMSKYLFDICIENGIFIPSNASLLAKFVDDNNMTVEANSLKNGDLIFISRDVGTYKNVTDVAIKVEGGYLNYWKGKIQFEKSLRVHTDKTYGSIVMYGQIN